MLWSIARACVQSVTIDEADTFLAYVAPQAPTHWSGSANNQILNSLLMRLFTSIFGISHLTARAPALIGAAIYIFAAYHLVRALARDELVAWPLYVCLVYNPFVMDHLVAARGYSLALAFWMAILALLARRPFTLRTTCIAASVCAGLSFSANFSFALAIAATMLVVCGWAWRQSGRPLAAVAACTLPGAAVALFFTGSVLATWPRNQFVYGSYSLGETFGGILKCSLYEVNPYLANPPLARFLERGAWLLAPLLAAACLWRGASCARLRPRWPAAFTAIAAGAIGAHWLLFRLAHVLLPKERTGIYFAPLALLIAGSLAVAPGGGELARRAVVAMLAVTAVYFVLCLRLTYFREWKWNAEAKETYSVLSYYNHTYGLEDITVNWRYVAALNFYRAASGHETIPLLESTFPPYPAGRDAYVLYYPSEEEVVRERHLKIVWYGRLSDTVVAIRPGLEGTTAGQADKPARRLRTGQWADCQSAAAYQAVSAQP